jgi:mRNA interferase HicA
VKLTDLIQTIEGFGCERIRAGGKHDWYRNPKSGVSQSVPRPREVQDRLARQIIRMLENPSDEDEGD